MYTVEFIGKNSY